MSVLFTQKQLELSAHKHVFCSKDRKIGVRLKFRISDVICHTRQRTHSAAEKKNKADITCLQPLKNKLK